MEDLYNDEKYFVSLKISFLIPRWFPDAAKNEKKAIMKLR